MMTIAHFGSVNKPAPSNPEEEVRDSLLHLLYNRRRLAVNGTGMRCPHV